MKFGILIIVCSLLFGISSDNKPTAYKFPTLPFFPPLVIPADNPVTIEGAELGRYLFYDSIISKDYTMSCGSCHQQKYAFSDAGKQFSIGITGERLQRNTLPLFNLAWYTQLFWDGRVNNLEAQIAQPLHAQKELGMDWSTLEDRLNASHFYREMFYLAFGTSTIDSILIQKAIAQFERTILSYNSKYDKVLRRETEFTADELEGFVIANEVNRGGCINCHATDGSPLGTNLKYSNNGLDSFIDTGQFPDKGLGGFTGLDRDIGKFKVPSLRNLAFTTPYMHDGRFQKLEDVLDFYNEGIQPGVNIDSKMNFAKQGGAHLTCEEIEKLIAFLLTLNDSTLITDPQFSNPFIEKK